MEEAAGMGIKNIYVVEESGMGIYNIFVGISSCFQKHKTNTDKRFE